MDYPPSLHILRKSHQRWLLCLLLWLASFLVALHAVQATHDVSDTRDRAPQVARDQPQPTKSKKTTQPTKKTKGGKANLQKIIAAVQDEDLRTCLMELQRTGKNPYPTVDVDVWLLKAIEEPHHALAIVKFLADKDMVSKSLPWFSSLDAHTMVDLPMHRAAYLGLVDIVKFLLEHGVTKYDPDHMFIAAMKSTSPPMVRLLLREKIFDKEQLYGSVPSILPQVLLIVAFACAIPATVWGLKRYHIVTFDRVHAKYYLIASWVAALGVLLHLFFYFPEPTSEGIGYLHILASLPIDNAPQGVKAKNISKIAKILLRSGANPNQQGSYIQTLGVKEIQQVDGFTPLHGAVRRGNLPLVKVLVRYKADVNALAMLKSFNRDNTLTDVQDNDLVLYLPFWGNLESKVLGVYTPLDYALQEHQQEVYRYLRSLGEPHKAKHYKDLFNFLS